MIGGGEDVELKFNNTTEEDYSRLLKARERVEIRCFWCGKHGPAFYPVSPVEGRVLKDSEWYQGKFKVSPTIDGEEDREYIEKYWVQNHQAFLFTNADHSEWGFAIFGCRRCAIEHGVVRPYPINLGRLEEYE